MSLAGQQIQKVYSEWCVKAAEIILGARIDGGQGAQRKSSSFNLQAASFFHHILSRPGARTFQREGRSHRSAGVLPTENAKAAKQKARMSYEFCSGRSKWRSTLAPRPAATALHLALTGGRRRGWTRAL